MTEPDTALHPQVDQALQQLQQLEHLPAHDHLPVLEQAHRLLQEALATLDEV